MSGRARRAVLLVTPLVLTACGGGDSRADTQPPPEAAAEARAPVRIFSPAPGRVLEARRLGRHLRAVVRLSGRAAPGQQLAVGADCGRYGCDGITFADSNGRWRTRMEVFSAAKRRVVPLRVSYADAREGERPARLRLRLRAAPDPQPPPAPPPSSLGSPTGGTAPAGGNPYDGPRTMIVIGDSLAIGMAPPLRPALADWDVRVDGRTGRPLAEGMDLLADTRLPPGERGTYAILGFSLFTNDDPRNVDALEAAVRASVSRLGAHGCAVWATIVRPPLGGVSYAAANRRLRALADEPDLAGRLLLVRWDRAVARHPQWLREDGVHATPEGYAARARLYARAARSCAA